MSGLRVSSVSKQAAPSQGDDMRGPGGTRADAPHPHSAARYAVDLSSAPKDHTHVVDVDQKKATAWLLQLGDALSQPCADWHGCLQHLAHDHCTDQQLCQLQLDCRYPNLGRR